MRVNLIQSDQPWETNFLQFFLLLFFLRHILAIALVLETPNLAKVMSGDIVLGLYRMIFAF